MVKSGLYSVAAHLQLNPAPALIAQTVNKAPVAVTRFELDAPSHGPTSPIPVQDAYMVVLQIGQRSYRELWLDGKAVRTEPLNPGEVAFHDLRRRPVFKMHSPIDSVNFYVPRDSLDAFAEDAGSPRITDLNFTPGIGVNDKVLAALGHALLPAFERPEHANGLFVDHVTLAVVAHLSQWFGGAKLRERAVYGGLAPWQERRIKEFLDANLDGNVSIALLAKECGLSASHFSRAFRHSVGMPPHQWLLRRRVDRARQLLRDPSVALADVALACGFADQSHLTHVFTRLTGIGPSAWRRANE